MGYQLYVDKDNCILKISKLTKNLEKEIFIITEKLYRFNDYYYVSTSRKVLKEKALELQLNWKMELEEKLKKINNIKL